MRVAPDRRANIFMKLHKIGARHRKYDSFSEGTLNEKDDAEPVLSSGATIAYRKATRQHRAATWSTTLIL